MRTPKKIERIMEVDDYVTRQSYLQSWNTKNERI